MKVPAMAELDSEVVLGLGQNLKFVRDPDHPHSLRESPNLRLECQSFAKVDEATDKCSEFGNDGKEIC
jgi:hypothetical protein